MSNPPRLTLDARLFLFVSSIFHRLLKLLFNIEPHDYKEADDYVNFEFDRHREFVAKFPGGIDSHGKRLLDAGCGKGGETIGYLDTEPALVVGMEIEVQHLSKATAFASEKAPGRAIHFLAGDGSALPFADGSLDLIVMHDVFEHLENPARVLAECSRVLSPGGRMYFSFGPLWYSPYGGHMFFFTLVPWAHLIVPQRTMFNARSKYRSDGARTYAEVGIHKMTVAKFERLLAGTDLKTVHLELQASRGLTFALKLPILRELFCREILCVLEKQ